MDSCILSWRMSIGCFYNRVHGVRCLQKTKCKFLFNFCFLSLSCLPSAVSLWNELSPNIKQCETFTTFQYQLKLHLFGIRKVPEYFLKGNRFLSVMHARIRNQCSNLNGDLFRNYLSNSPACSCGYETEDANHYFFNCNKYIDKRILMFRKTHNFHPLSVETILFGKSGLSDNDNFLLFQAVQQYIKDTGRFAP